MKQTNKTRRAFLCAALGLGLATAGLFYNGASASAGQGGRLVIKGSDTLLPLAQQWAQAFSGKNPGADITVTGGGSSTGIAALINGTTDIADASRKIKPSELEKAKARGVIIKEYAVARDGLSIVVHPSNPLKEISVEDLGRIYAGQVNNWKQIGGPDLKIVTSGRDSSSGTYAFFQEDVLKNQRYRADMISTPSNNSIANNVAAQNGGVGYIGVAYAKEFADAGKVKILPVAFSKGGTAVYPTDDNVQSGKYPISRPLYNYTAGVPRGLAAKYLDFVRSTEGQQIVEKVGYVPLKLK